MTHMRTAMVAAILTFALSTPCLAMGKPDSAPGDAKSGYTRAEQAVKAREYRRAIGMLEKVVSAEPRNVDALNYLGYSHRQLGEYRKSLAYYKRALGIDPDHRGANEYLGQLYLRTGNLEGARSQLARLRKLCPRGCEERDSLKAAIDKAAAGRS